MELPLIRGGSKPPTLSWLTLAGNAFVQIHLCFVGMLCPVVPVRRKQALPSPAGQLSLRELSRADQN